MTIALGRAIGGRDLDPIKLASHQNRNRMDFDLWADPMREFHFKLDDMGYWGWELMLAELVLREFAKFLDSLEHASLLIQLDL